MLKPTAISDAGPIHYLTLLHHDALLQHYFSEFVIPQAVHIELTHPNSPELLRSLLQVRPPWIRVAAQSAIHPAAAGLGAGEAQAISIALEYKSAESGLVLLSDDGQARLIARRLGLRITGTLGLLLQAGRDGRIEANKSLNTLFYQTNFRAGKALIARVLELASNPS